MSARGICSAPRLLTMAALLVFSAAPEPVLGGSPFYLTVERSFAAGERPQVRLDFVSAELPLVLRVLRPQNLDQFLEGQLNISRSYEEPLARINPGHYVVESLNKVESPLSLFRSTLHPEFRKSFRSDVLKHSTRSHSDSPIATAPEEITLGPPAGFDLVREEFIDLQKGGQLAPGLYDEFYWGNQNRYQVRDIALDPLPDGLYLLQATQGKTEAQALLQISSLSVQVKQSSSQLVVRVIDRALKPVAGARVVYRDSRGSWQELAGTTDVNGELLTGDPGGYDGKLVLRVRAAGDRSAIIDTDFLSTQRSDPSVFIVTDRPIFKPGETFSFKGTIRSLRDGQLQLPSFAATNATVRVLRQDGSDTGISRQTALTDFGSFSGAFDLASSEPPGLYRLAVEVDHKLFAGEFRVRDYVKPTFYLELIERDPTIRPGATFRLRFRARRYAGGVPRAVKYETFVYRKRFEAPGFVVEAGGGLETQHDYFGQTRSASALSEPQRLYSSVEARVAAGNGDATSPWQSAAVVDENGEGSIEILLPEVPQKDFDFDWIYTVMIRAMDATGSQAVLTENIYMTQAAAAVAARFDRVISDPEAKEVQLLLRTTYPDGRPAAAASGHVELALDRRSTAPAPLSPISFQTDERGMAALRIARPMEAGRLRATAILEALDGKAFVRAFRADPAVVVIAAKEGEAVLDNSELELHAERTVLSPGERMRVLALLPRDWGQNEEGVLWETRAGATIFGTEAAQFRGRSRWFEVEARPEYGTGFYETITVPLAGGKYHEQSIGFRIVPDDKRLEIQVSPSADIAEPLEPFVVSFQVRGRDGKPAADTELSVNVVDRAVYAVQPEFRPEILDFFYPLPRLNLATFYSDELQGYGYADELTRPNFRLAALKSNVQPAKRDMRDTAGWFPRVVTDAEGRAQVTVEMPANVTEWVVTAIAADRSGRAGEGRGSFRSATDVAIEPRLPSFLRRDDSADGFIDIQNHLDQVLSVDLDLVATDGLTLTSGASASNVEVSGKGSALVPVSITARSEEGEGLLRMRATTSADVRTGGPSTVAIDVRPAAVDQIFEATRQGAALQFPPLPRSTSGELRVRIYSGLLGAVLAGAAELVSYPYGCTEQLSHTTLPNLLLLDLVKQTELDLSSLGTLGLSSAVQRARTNAQLGIDRLISNQKSDGGFSLWTVDSESNLAVTLIAARVLHLASELEMPAASSALQRTYAFLNAKLESSPIDSSTALGVYQLELLSESGLLDPGFDSSLALVNRATRQENVPLHDLIAALRIVQLQSERYWFMEKLEGGENTGAVLAQRLKDRIRKSLDSPERCSGFSDLGFCYGDAAEAAQAFEALHPTPILDVSLRERLTARILAGQRNGWWRSTFESGEVLYRLRQVIAAEARSERERARQARQVRFASLTDELKAIPGGWVGNFAIAGEIPSGAVEIDGLQPGETATSLVELAVPFAAVRAHDHGMKVDRRWLRVAAGGATEMVAPMHLNVGDVVVSKVTVTRTNAPTSVRYDLSPSDYVVVQDPMPSSAEAIEEDRAYLADAQVQPDDNAYWASVKETYRYPDRTERIVHLKPGGSMTLYQVWRVGFAGTATAPPASAVDMYDDEIAGNGEPTTLAATRR